MRSKVIFGHPNAIESDFRSFKMVAGHHLVNRIWRKKIAYWNDEKSNRKFKENKSCALIYNGEKCDRKWFSVIQNGGQRPFCKKNVQQNKVVYWSEMTRNVIESDFWSSKMASLWFCFLKIVYDVFGYDLACLLHSNSFNIFFLTKMGELPRRWLWNSTGWRFLTYPSIICRVCQKSSACAIS